MLPSEICPVLMCFPVFVPVCHVLSSRSPPPLEFLKEVMDQVMDAEMQRAGIAPGYDTPQPLDLPYSHVVHASEDKKGVESPHVHVIVLAMDRGRDRPFNVYPRDTQRTCEIVKRRSVCLICSEHPG
jgi:hypothetical protein